jgi:hypothetical protein
MTQAYNLSQFGNKVNTNGQASLTTAVSGILPVANGGTGASTLTANNVMLGNGTGAIQFVAPSTSGNSLVSNGTSWVSSTPSNPPKLSTASGSAPSYSTRAFVNFNGTGTVAIRGSKNVSYITDNGVGRYAVYMTVAMQTVDYIVTATPSGTASDMYCVAAEVNYHGGSLFTPTVNEFQIWTEVTGQNNAYRDPLYVMVNVIE